MLSTKKTGDRVDNMLIRREISQSVKTQICCMLLVQRKVDFDKFANAHVSWPQNATRSVPNAMRHPCSCANAFPKSQKLSLHPIYSSSASKCLSKTTDKSLEVAGSIRMDFMRN